MELMFATRISLLTVSTARPEGFSNPVSAPLIVPSGLVSPLAFRL